MEIKVCSFLNYDGYQLSDGETFGCWQVEEMVKYLKAKNISEVTFVKGRNIFTESLVDDDFFQIMQTDFYKIWGV